MPPCDFKFKLHSIEGDIFLCFLDYVYYYFSFELAFRFNQILCVCKYLKRKILGQVNCGFFLMIAKKFMDEQSCWKFDDTIGAIPHVQ